MIVAHGDFEAHVLVDLCAEGWSEEEQLLQCALVVFELSLVAVFEGVRMVKFWFSLKRGLACDVIEKDDEMEKEKKTTHRRPSVIRRIRDTRSMVCLEGRSYPLGSEPSQPP